jgi:hypothetical protein
LRLLRALKGKVANGASKKPFCRTRSPLNGLLTKFAVISTNYR